MITQRLQLALERLQPSDWARFEKLASAFLSAEFDNLRTTASAAGDRGRDSELFSPEHEPSVIIQYSVASQWDRKILDTAKRIGETFPHATMLVFLSNQLIGAAGDALKRRLRTEQGLTLDIRDRQWFVDRVLGSATRERAAEELSEIIVDPLLASAGVQARTPADLSLPEAVAALTYLNLQWQDDNRQKGLTKLVFEALVRAVLVGTNSDNRLSRRAVQEAVQRLLPDHPPSQLNLYVNAALKRLTKRVIRHWMKTDEFCHSYAETKRLAAFKTQAALAELNLAESIKRVAAEVLEARGVSLDYLVQVALSIRRATEDVLFAKSQAFAIAVQRGSLADLLDDDFRTAVTREVGLAELPRKPGIGWGDILLTGIREVLLSDDEAINIHLRSLSDAQTLLAFLRQTPDVQGAVEKMFSHGQIWLDASLILPLIAETLDEDSTGRFTRMISAAREAGLGLFVTSGILEEVERHMNKSLACARMAAGSWQGGIPFLFERFVASGRSPQSFASWLENFRGDQRPIDDIADYLEEIFGIERRDLAAESKEGDSELRFALQQYWHGVHSTRRLSKGAPIDEIVLTRLVEHDVECYCGVIQIRTKERGSAFGYSAWWLTLDRKAFNLKGALTEIMRSDPPDSPVLSADFMVNYLAFGPVRRRIPKAMESHLPLIMEAGAASALTPELLAEAESFRDSIQGLPERVIRRRVRDHLDRAKRRLGPIAAAGTEELIDDFDSA